MVSRCLCTKQPNIHDISHLRWIHTSFSAQGRCVVPVCRSGGRYGTIGASAQFSAPCVAGPATLPTPPVPAPVCLSPCPSPSAHARRRRSPAPWCRGRQGLLETRGPGAAANSHAGAARAAAPIFCSLVSQQSPTANILGSPTTCPAPQPTPAHVCLGASAGLCLRPPSPCRPELHRLCHAQHAPRRRAGSGPARRRSSRTGPT